MRTLLTDLQRRLRHPWLPAPMHQRIRPLRFSLFTPERTAECMDLYERNLPHGLPADHRDAYAESLREGNILTLVADTAEGMVGTFGVQRGYQTNVIWLCYVMVRPDLHRSGVGVTLWLATLALLGGLHEAQSVAVSSVPRSLGFYQRLGFLRVGETPHTNGDMHPIAVFSPVTQAMSRGSLQLLHGAGATLPDGPYRIPQAKLPRETAQTA